MAFNFEDVLTADISDFKRPPNVPAGWYSASVKKITLRNQPGEKFDWGCIDILFQLLEPDEDVDSELLEEYGPLNNTFVRSTFMAAENSPRDKSVMLARVKTFMTKHLGMEDHGQFQTMLDEALGLQCMVLISHRQDKRDPENFYDEVKSTAPLE